MNKIIAVCGNRCDLCPAYKENIKGIEDQKKISEGWIKYHGFKLEPEKIICGGCFLGECKTLRESCPIKECAEKKGLENCGHCSKLFCRLLKNDICAVETSLETHKNISEEDYDLFFRPYEIKKTLAEIRESLKNKKI